MDFLCSLDTTTILILLSITISQQTTTSVITPFRLYSILGSSDCSSHILSQVDVTFYLIIFLSKPHTYQYHVFFFLLSLIKEKDNTLQCCFDTNKLALYVLVYYSCRLEDIPKGKTQVQFLKLSILGFPIKFKHVVALTNEIQIILSFSRIFKFNIFEFNQELNVLDLSNCI